MSHIDNLIKEHPSIDIDMVKKIGFVISKTLDIEHLINNVVKNHLFPTVSKEEVDIFNDFLVDLKSPERGIILKSTLLKLGIELSKTKELIKHLAEIYLLRNKLAHWRWSYILDEGDTGLVNHKSNRKTFIITDEKLDSFVHSVDFISANLSIINFNTLIQEDRHPLLNSKK